MNSTILIIEDDVSLAKTYGGILKNNGFLIEYAYNYSEAMEAISNKEFDVIMADIILDKPTTGIDILSALRELGKDAPYIIMTGNPELKTASDALRMGAYDYLIKPVDKNKLISLAKKASSFHRLRKENEIYRTNLDTIFSCIQEGIIAVNHQMEIIEINDAAQRLCSLSPENRETRITIQNQICSRKCLTILNETLKTGNPARVSKIECCNKFRPNQIVSITASPFSERDSAKAGAIMVIMDETRLMQLEREQTEGTQYYRLVGSSMIMKRLYSLINLLSQNDSTVLITGESGTGKELVAEAIHKHSPRANGPFIAVNCTAIPEALLESELFGHTKGSFSGAIADKKGKFELADTGTIFLDEIGDMPLPFQAKLLRVLQERTIDRVGGTQSIHLDFRVIAATNRSLQQLVVNGKFREDLFYRLRICEITTPALRDRKEDIPLLVKTFVNELSKTRKKRITTTTSEVVDAFMEYGWPGNVRELRGAVESAMGICTQEIITIDDLPSWIFETPNRESMDTGDNYNKRIPNEEITRVLIECKGNKTEAAKRLNINRRTIYRKLSGIEI